MDLDILLEHVRDLEKTTENTITASWKNNFLPFYGENPFEKSQPEKKSRSKRGNFDELGGDIYAFLEIQLWEQRLRKAENRLKMWEIPREEMISQLTNLRNLWESEKKLSPYELELLKPGKFLLYTVKPDFLDIHFGIDDMEKGAADTICFIKDEKGITMHLPFQKLFRPVSLSQKNWVYRKGGFIAFSLQPNSVFTMKFYENKNAMKFEHFFTCLAAFADGNQIINLQGDFPVPQLMANNFGKTEHDLQLPLFVLRDIQKRHTNNDPPKFELPKEDFMKDLVNKAAEYLKHVYDLQSFIFKESLALDASKEILDIGHKIVSDLGTLRKILNFCVLPRDARKLPTGQTVQDVTKILVEIHDNLMCCDKLHSSNDLYHHWFTTFKNTFGFIWDEVCEAPTDIFAEMEKYLKTCEDSSISPTVFIKLDGIFRIAKESKFDVFFKNLVNEFAEILFKTTTIKSISKDFFCERNDDFSFRDDPILKNLENEVAIADLTEKPKTNPLTNTNRLSAAENIVNEKVRHCVANLRDFTKAIEKNFNFDIEQWLQLVTVWKNFDTNRHEFENNQITTQAEQSPNSSISSESYEKVDHVDVSSLDNEKPDSEWDHFQFYKDTDFDPIRTLGKGSYATAYIVRHKEGWKAALKFYHDGINDYDTTSLVERKKEIDMLIRLQSETENIVKLYGFLYTEDGSHSIPDGILLEYIERNLHSFIHDPFSPEQDRPIFKKFYTLKTAVKQMRDMASAFAIMHGQGIMHRDINPKNILLTNGDKVKICDFGMCGFIDKTFKTVNVGTKEYNSPEVLGDSHEYTEKADVFSLGPTLWEQIHRRIPYWNLTKNVTDFVRSGGRMDFCSACPEELKNVIKRAWSHDPVDRPTMTELRDMLDGLLKTLPTDFLHEEVLGPFEKRNLNGQIIYQIRK